MTSTLDTVRVLLVEDEPADAGLVRVALRGSGVGEFALTHVGSLAEALDRVGRGGVDVVLLDLSLPDSQGFETLRAMRRAAPALPVLPLTGHDDPHFALAAVEAGAQDFLVKGQAEGPLLGRAIRHAILRKHLEDELRVSEERFKAIVTLAHDAVVVADEDERVVLFNPAAEAMFGHRAADVLGRPVERLLPERFRTPHGDAAALFARSDRTSRGHVKGRELWALHAEGHEFPVEISISKLAMASGVLVAAMVRDVTEARRVQWELEKQAADMAALAERLDRALADAEQASLAKSEFLAVMSHEIRTPMNGILGMTRLLLDSLLSADQRQKLEVVHDSGEALLAILNDILDFSRLEAGRVDLERTDFDLARVVTSTVSLMASRAEQKRLALEVDFAPGVPRMLVGDPGRLRQVLLNLVGNAVKFTDRGEVRVCVEPFGGEELGGEDSEVLLRFSIIDSGIGIPPQVRSRLFQSFTQADASISRRFGGSGLGLAICKRLVELMGGTIGVESEPGRGSRFHFTAPFRRSARRDAMPASGDPAAIPALAPMNILLAEDNMVNQMVARGFLERQDHRVTVVPKGRQAVEAARLIRYDAILMDMQMPEMDGLEATRAIRALAGEAANVPIIALTANAMPGDNERCLAAGMDAYVKKPIKPAELFAALARFQHGELHMAPPPPPGLPTFDGAVIDTLGDAVGQLMLRSLIDQFMEEAADVVQRILSAAAREDMDAARREAHDLKSTAATFGLLALSRHAEAIEQACRDRHLGEASALAADLEERFVDGAAALRRHAPRAVGVPAAAGP